MNKEKILYIVSLMLSILFIVVGLHEFDVEHKYLTGLFLTFGGIAGILEIEYENRQNKTSFK